MAISWLVSFAYYTNGFRCEKAMLVRVVRKGNAYTNEDKEKIHLFI